MSDEQITPIKRWPNRPRLKGFTYDGDHAYHVVFNTVDHEPLLVGRLADAVMRSIVDAAGATQHELLAFVVMPNHVHALVQGEVAEAALVRFAQRCKQKPGYEYRQATGRRLWLPSFYDRLVRRGDDAREIAAYIVANPVRAGLILDGERWPYSGGTFVTEIRRS